MGDPAGNRPPIDPETLRRIKEALVNWRHDPEMRRQMEEIRSRWDEAIRPEIEAIERSQRLTAEDYATRVY